MNPECVTNAQKAKARNIAEMSLDFSGMTRVFQKGSQAQILSKLEQFFADLRCVFTKEKNYDRLHVDFCNWFTQNIKQNDTVSQASYGQAAKVLDISAKVYIYYCAQPLPDTAEVLIPLLHAALDNKMVKHLIRRFDAGVRASGLVEVDRCKYEQLQSLVVKEIEEDFHSAIYPVQYDDILFRRLNRSDAALST